MQGEIEKQSGNVSVKEVPQETYAENSGNSFTSISLQKADEQPRLPFEGLRIGVAVCGSFCTFKKVFETTERLRAMGAEIIPIMSFNAASISSRFGKAEENLALFESLAGRKAIVTIEDAEPIGPKKMTDVMLLPNCTGNTMAKLAMSITDTPVTMAVKSHLRGGRPVVVNVATNDALSGSAKNIGALMNLRHYYFVPLRQDDHRKKPTSIVGDFSLIPDTISYALNGVQLQAVLREPQGGL